MASDQGRATCMSWPHGSGRAKRRQMPARLLPAVADRCMARTRVGVLSTNGRIWTILPAVDTKGGRPRGRLCIAACRAKTERIVRLLKEKRSERRVSASQESCSILVRTPTCSSYHHKIWISLSVSDRNGVAGDPSTACSDLITVVECAVVVGT